MPSANGLYQIRLRQANEFPGAIAPCPRTVREQHKLRASKEGTLLSEDYMTGKPEH